MRAGISLSITPADMDRLQALVKDGNAPQKHVGRARIVLLTAEGVGTIAIMRETGKSKTCVWRWQGRFAVEGVEGLLRDKTRPSRIPKLDPTIAELCRPQTSFQRLQGDIYGMISDAKTLFLGVVSFADFAPMGCLTRKLTHTVNGAAPMQTFMGAMPIVVGDPLRELFADVGRFGVGSFPELLQYRSLHTLHFAIQVWGARRYWPKPDGFVHQSALNFLGEELGPPVSLNPLD
jgi:Winged helix-turn helix